MSASTCAASSASNACWHVGPASRLALVRDDRGSAVIDTDLGALGPLVTILGGMEKGEELVGADYRDRPDFWRGS